MGESKNGISMKKILIPLIVMGIMLFLISKRIFAYLYGGGTLLFLLYLFLWNNKFKGFTKENKIYVSCAMFTLSVFFFCAIPGASTNDSNKVKSIVSPEAVSTNKNVKVNSEASINPNDSKETKPNINSTALSENKPNPASEPKNDNDTVSSLELEKDPAKFKASCMKVTYNDIARNPDKYLGEKVVFTGKVLQVLNSSKYTDLLVEIDGKIMYVSCGYFLNYKGDNILNDDSVTFWGQCLKQSTYKTVLGSNNTVPTVIAYYIQIN